MFKKKNEKSNVKPNVKAEQKKSKKESPLDKRLKEEIIKYNKEYASLNDLGTSLFMNRKRAVDLITIIEALINSIANSPKEFEKDISEIKEKRIEFKNACEFATQELEAAKKAAAGVGAGAAGAVAFASLAPSAAMWVATTFGTASTGTAISALSGAAATSAKLAWLGGGALAAHGGGMAAGQAFLAMAGPIGWGIAGASLLTSIALFINGKHKRDEEKMEEIESVLKNTDKLRKTRKKLEGLFQLTASTRDNLMEQYMMCMDLCGKDYLDLPEDKQFQLGTLVNNTKSLAILLSEDLGE